MPGRGSNSSTEGSPRLGARFFRETTPIFLGLAVAGGGLFKSGGPRRGVVAHWVSSECARSFAKAKVVSNERSHREAVIDPQPVVAVARFSEQVLHNVLSGSWKALGLFGSERCCCSNRRMWLCLCVCVCKCGVTLVVCRSVTVAPIETPWCSTVCFLNHF